VNELPPRLRNGFYVLNLNGQSHWVGLLKNGSKYYYFDSFGFGAPTVLEKKMSKDYVWNDEDIQHIDSSSCGWYVVCWMRTMMHDPTERGYRSFMKLFNKRNNEENEAVLGGLLPRYVRTSKKLWRNLVSGFPFKSNKKKSRGSFVDSTYIFLKTSLLVPSTLWFFTMLLMLVLSFSLKMMKYWQFLVIVFGIWT
jgi:hypothetical protein